MQKSKKCIIKGFEFRHRDEEYDDYDDFEDSSDSEDLKPKKAKKPKRETYDDYEDTASYGAYSNPGKAVEEPVQRPASSYSNKDNVKVLSVGGKSQKGNTDVCMIMPRSFDDATTIADMLLEYKAVVLTVPRINESTQPPVWTSDELEAIADYAAQHGVRGEGLVVAVLLQRRLHRLTHPPRRPHLIPDVRGHRHAPRQNTYYDIISSFHAADRFLVQNLVRRM